MPTQAEVAAAARLQAAARRLLVRSRVRARLHAAVSEGDAEACARAMRQWPGAVNARNATRHAPLHVAVVLCHAGCIDALLANRAVDVNAATPRGWTALHIACRAGFEPAVARLLQHRAGGAAAVDGTLRDGDGMTAARVAASAGHEHIVAALLEHKQVGQPAEVKAVRRLLREELAARRRNTGQGGGGCACCWRRRRWCWSSVCCCLCSSGRRCWQRCCCCFGCCCGPPSVRSAKPSFDAPDLLRVNEKRAR